MPEFIDMDKEEQAIDAYVSRAVFPSGSCLERFAFLSFIHRCQEMARAMKQVRNFLARRGTVELAS